MKRFLAVFAAVLLCSVGMAAAEERLDEYLFGLQYSDIDNVGANGSANFEWTVPFGNTVRVGPMFGLVYFSPDAGPSITGYDAGGLVAFDFGNRSAFFLEGTILWAFGDTDEVVDYTYGIGGGYKVWSGRTVVKVRASLEQVEFTDGSTEDRLVSGVAIGFGR